MRLSWGASGRCPQSHFPAPFADWRFPMDVLSAVSPLHRAASRCANKSSITAASSSACAASPEETNVTLHMENDQSRLEPGAAAASAPTSTGQELPTLPEDAVVIVPVRNMVLFPGLILPVNIGRESSIAAVQHAV